MSFKMVRGPRLVLPTGEVGPYSWETTSMTPDSIKRPFPEDPFASSTPRTVFETAYTNVVYPAFKFGDTQYCDFLSSGRETSWDWADETAATRSKLASKIKNQNVNLAQAMVEYRQSATLFLSLARELYSGYRALRRLDFSLLSGALKGRDKAYSKKWIEYQFGLLPVVSDLQGLCDSLALGLRNGVQLQATASSGTKTRRYYRRYPNPVHQGYLQHWETEHFNVRLKARYTIQELNVHNVARFGFFNVPSLAWELVPFSFVVDWAIGIGPWLNNLDALHGVSSVVYIQGTKTSWAGQTSSESGGSTATQSSVHKARSQTISGLPLGYPVYKPSESLTKIATGMALLQLIH